MRPATTACIQPVLGRQHWPRSPQHPGETPSTQSRSSGPRSVADAGPGWAGRMWLSSSPGPGWPPHPPSPWGPEPTVPEWGPRGRSVALKQGGWGGARTPHGEWREPLHGGEQSWAERVHSGLPGGLPWAQGGRGLTSPPADFPGLTPPFWPKT